MTGKYLDPKADLTFKLVFGEHPDLVMNSRSREANRENARKMKELGVEKEIISQVIGLPIEDIE